MALFILRTWPCVGFDMFDPRSLTSKAMSGLVCGDSQFNWPSFAPVSFLAVRASSFDLPLFLGRCSG